MQNQFFDEEKVERGEYSSHVFSTLQMAYQPYFLRCIFSLIVGFLGRLALLGTGLVIAGWVDGSLFGFQFSNVDSFLWTLGILNLVGFSCTVVFRLWFSRLSAQAVSTIYDETTMRTSRFAISFFDKTPVGRVMTRFSSDYGNIFRLFGGPIAEFFSLTFDLIAIIVLLAFLNPGFLVWVLAVGYLNYRIYLSHRLRLREARRDVSQLRGPAMAHFAETAQGALLIRTFSKEKIFQERFSHLDLGFLKAKTSASEKVYRFNLSMNSLSILFYVLTAGLAYLGVQLGFLTMGGAGAALAYVVLSGYNVQMFFDWMTQFDEAFIGVERMDSYLRRELEPGTALPFNAQFKTGQPQETGPKSKNQIKPTAVEVEIENLSFRYNKEQDHILKNVNLKINAGEKIGLIGRTGSGKSSLLQALFYLYPLDQGVIKLNGLSPSEDFPLDTYRSWISWISQEPNLFSGSLRDNLDPLKLHTDAELAEALSQVGMYHVSLSLAQIVEEKGRNFSLGERQLICMARCLLQNCPLIIMDEATASVDPHSEELIQMATKKVFQGKTQIRVAHRLSTLLDCDRIVWIESGKIKKIGTTKEVLTSWNEALT